MATIRDVARRAAVAPITVSRVLNEPSLVSGATRERVEAAIRELKYVPNMVGQGLRRRRTMTLALIVSDITNPFAIQQITAVSDAARGAGYTVIFGHTQGDPAEELRQLRSMIERRVDGIILSPVRNGPAPVEFVQQSGREIVVLGYRMPANDVDAVRCDTRAAATELTQYLIGLGHRRIVMLSGPEEIVTATERADGYADAMAAAGLPAEVHYGAFSTASGYDLAGAVFRSATEPTALVTANNFLALGAARRARESGLTVPDELSIVTFDNARTEVVHDPFFTGIVQPIDAMARRATELLLERLDGRHDGPGRDVVFPTVLDVHGSSAPTPRPSTHRRHNEVEGTS
ncbi:LacI family transcriptional regulator [Enemella evansiae]|uniref:LacI family DNA-binding transcriptional regulator n=1 Tax=Enemella evansiae TaxID=2016499 RepID=UPI000B9734E1|nr:LacI family DNA-binding transcriptional regulator [Enemella evansiae]OYN99659.1 LacI family transcriptional regulator [Enemella evansiae]